MNDLPRLIVLLVALLAGVAGFILASQWSAKSEPKFPVSVAKSAGIGDYRPDFTHGSVSGDIYSMSDFTGKVVLVNFWATWCIPCRAEMPLLQSMQETYGPQGLQIIGIALDDVARVRDFAAELGISYPNLVGAGDVMATGLDYGNSSGTLPYSVLVDRSGIIRWRIHGAIDEASFIARVAVLL